MGQMPPPLTCITHSSQTMVSEVGPGVIGRYVEVCGSAEIHIERTLGHRGGGRGCVRMCGVEVLDMCGSVCVSVYGEVVVRWVVVCGDGEVVGVFGVQWLWVCLVCGGVWRFVEVCGQAQRYVGRVRVCREEGGMCEGMGWKDEVCIRERRT